MSAATSTNHFEKALFYINNAVIGREQTMERWQTFAIIDIQIVRSWKDCDKWRKSSLLTFSVHSVPKEGKENFREQSQCSKLTQKWYATMRRNTKSATWTLQILLLRLIIFSSPSILCLVCSDNRKQIVLLKEITCCLVTEKQKVHQTN